MASIEEIREARLKKLELLKDRGVNPYPADSKREMSLSEVLSNFGELENSTEPKWISGRIISLRGQGAIVFVTLQDGTAKFQGVLKEDTLEKMDFFKDVVDIGDFVEIRGTFFVTQRGEKSLLAKEWRMLAKSLSPLPEKWHGLVDSDERFRKRYLDILMNDDLKDLFIKKSKFWDATRAFLKREGFLEIETPTLEVTTGGAEARPFLTHHNDFDLDVFLRISVGELWQKRLMAAGFPKTFEIGRVYRNEGSSPEHTQEFTNMEFYAAYLNFEDGKELIKKLYREIALEVFGTTKFETRGHAFDLADEWKELDYVSTIKEMTGINVLEDDEAALKSKLEELNVKFEGNNRERMTDSLWKYCRKSVSGPAFLVNHPKLVAPLSKEHPDNPKATKTFQVILAGSEIGRAHAELNDPIDQLMRFNKQRELIEGGDDEAMMLDTEFVEMLEHGMPPTFGFGFGERLFAFFVDKPLRETQLFPLMRPKN
jgi:lysyl-tRNA synthetase, class II